MAKIRSHSELDVYKLAFEATMIIFELTKDFPIEEKYSLVDQIRRSSRSVCTNIAEAFGKRRYPNAFVSSITIAEGEALETKVWLEFSDKCGYVKSIGVIRDLNQKYDFIIGKLINLSLKPEQWKP